MEHKLTLLAALAELSDFSSDSISCLPDGNRIEQARKTNQKIDQKKDWLPKDGLPKDWLQSSVLKILKADFTVFF